MRIHDAIVAATIALVTLAAAAQAPAGTPRIGFLGVDRIAQGPRVAALVDGLRALGYEDGRNIVIEYRWADGQFDKLPQLADDLVRSKVDVIVTASIVQTMEAARQATKTIPIVIPNMNDPVEMGLVASLARPGGNITGLAFQDVEVGVKRLDLFRQMVPGLTRLAIVYQRGSGSRDEALRAFEAAALKMGLQVRSFEVKGQADFAPAVAAAKSWGAQGVFQFPAFYTTPVRRHFMETLAAARLPAACEGRHYVEDGCLMSYNGSFEAVFRKSAVYIDRILKGAKPADLPVEQARDFEFAINEKTAQTLGLAISREVRVQATEILR
jgi:putative ABC transport system substrate-binding protein